MRRIRACRFRPRNLGPVRREKIVAAGSVTSARCASLRHQFSGKLSRSQPPLPVPTVQAGRYSCAASLPKPQNILQRDQGKLRHRVLRPADERPLDAIVATAEIGLRITALVLCRARVKPSHGRIIVVGSGVDHFAGRAMGQMHVRAFVVKPKLQNRHSWHLQPVPQRMNLRGDVAQIFREERQSAQRLAQLVKQIVLADHPPSGR